jgi:hypothetical protein
VEFSHGAEVALLAAVLEQPDDASTCNGVSVKCGDRRTTRWLVQGYQCQVATLLSRAYHTDFLHPYPLNGNEWSEYLCLLGLGPIPLPFRHYRNVRATSLNNLFV